MACKICNKSSCISWMHSLEEQEAWDSLDNWDEYKLKSEIISLRGEVKELKGENFNLKDEITDLEKQLYDKS